MKKNIIDLIVTSKELLSNNYVLLKLTTKDGSLLPEMLPGQFSELRVDNSPNTFLRRPISINFVDTDKNEIWYLVQMIGDGTKKLGELNQGDILNVVTPLGNGFSASAQEKEVLLVGGGVGTAPMLYLGFILKKSGVKVNFLLGARSGRDLLQLQEFEKYGTVYTTTEDGSMGEKGFVTNHTILDEKSFSRIFTCGPKPMMMAVAKYATEKKIECEVSLENTMACGFGVCLCCVEKTKEGHKCVCSEGPVFNIKELTWQI